MTRQEQLKSIGYLLVSDIAEKLFMHKSTVKRTIKKLDLLPFEKRYYSEEQIELIKNYRG